MVRTTIDFGIDLGTTNSTIAVIEGTDAIVIPNKVGSGITPSAVWIDKRGNIHVGQEAKLRALVEDNDNADVEFKLRMGLGEEGKKVFADDGRQMLPEELSAEVLKSLKIDVQTYMGEEIRAAVITVPAAFENPSTSATQTAATLAGFNLSPLLLEPVAASLAYGFQSEKDNVYWMVYDFGGGTFDAAVMRIRDGLIQVVNHDGDNFLGGKLIDWDLVTKKLVPAITKEFNLADFQRGNRKWNAVFGKLKYYVEQAKIEVCRTRTPYEIWIENLCKDGEGQEVDFSYKLTPEDVEEISRPFIERSLNLCRKTLLGAGLNGSDMERILMVGGTTLNPWVRDSIKAEISSQVEFGIDPISVVARGAAIFAGTRTLPPDVSASSPAGTWRIDIEHQPVGNVPDPDIGGRIIPPDGVGVVGCEIEFVDELTQWRSGRIRIEADGLFMTQLYAEKKRQHKYAIELFDETGTRIPTSPEQVSYTLGVIPEDPPIAMTIGVGLANGTVATYFDKGTTIPEHGLRKTLDHYTVVTLRSGHSEDEVNIPLLEGEHPRAERNHGIGVMSIRGSDIHRDLPAGNLIEITLFIDQSQQLRLEGYISSLDKEFAQNFDSQMKHNSPEELLNQVKEQTARLANVREKAEETNAPMSEDAISRIENQKLVEHIDSLVEAVENDAEAATQLDRRLRELAAAVDELEDSIEWPKLLHEAEESRDYADRVVEQYGESSDRNRFNSIEQQLQKAIDLRVPDLVHRSMNDLDALHDQVLDRQPAYHVARFDWLLERLQSMRDPGQAEQIITQGRRAINNNDIEALKAASRQLVSLLPVEVQQEATHVNVGGTIV